MRAHSFFSMVRSFIAKHQVNGNLTQVGEKGLTFKPKASLAFPVRDVDTYQEEKNEWVFICQLMGLYGVDSPLPIYLNQQCLGKSDAATLRRHFLDVLNHRCYALYFSSWHVFQPEYAASKYHQVLASLVESPNPSLPLAFIGSIYEQTSFIGLRERLYRLAPSLPIVINKSIRAWTSFEASIPLGQGSTLAENICLGNHFYHNRAVRIDFGPLSLVEGQCFFPQGEKAPGLVSLLTACLVGVTTVEIRFIIQMKAQPWSLGQDKSQLGWCSLMTSSDEEYCINIDIPLSRYR